MSSELVSSVINVSLSVIQKGNQSQLLITAKGQVPTPGWTNPELVPFVYIQAPPDGIYDFNFVAERPDGMQPQVLSTIDVKHVLNPLPANLKGVRIHSATNAVEALLSAKEVGS